MTVYEHYLYYDWFKSDKIRKELIYARPHCGWRENTLRLFAETRHGNEGFDEKINWENMVKKIENDLTFLRLTV